VPVEQRLEELRKAGYLFHGSPVDIKGPLMPRLAQDDAKLSGNRSAVYLTEVPVEALFCALVGPECGRRECHVAYDIDAKTGLLTYRLVQLGVERPEQLATEGFVYVVSRHKTYEYIDGEWLAYEPVKPVQQLRVSRDDLTVPVAGSAKINA
jgi:hypothetical protein